MTFELQNSFHSIYERIGCSLGRSLICCSICPKCFAYSSMPGCLCSADYLLQEVAHRFVECFCETVGRSMIHGRLVLLELVFLAELVHELAGELFFAVSDDLARHTVLVDDMLLDETDDNFLLNFH